MPSLLQALALILTGSFSTAHMVSALKTEFAQAQCYHVRPQCGNGIELCIHVIYQTRETVFHRDIQTAKRELKIRRVAEYFLTKFEVFG